MKGKSKFTIGFDIDLSDPEAITKVEKALRTTMRNKPIETADQRLDRLVNTADQCTFCDQPEDLTVWVGGPCCARCRVTQGLGK